MEVLYKERNTYIFYNLSYKLHGNLDNILRYVCDNDLRNNSSGPVYGPE